MKIGGSLGSSSREVTEFRILHGRNRTISEIAVLDFRRANSDLYKYRRGGIPGVRALGDNGAQERAG